MTPLSDATDYQAALSAVLPEDLPNRAQVIDSGAAHLARMREVNRQMNLTRIIEPREAAIKHVLDSLLPWRLFENYKVIADIGSGPGFPGIPLALVFPAKRILLIESIGKKAKFLSDTVLDLGVQNVEVHNGRAEDILRQTAAGAIVARAVASCDKLLKLLKPVLRKDLPLFLFKGGDVDAEIQEAEAAARHLGRTARIEMRYDLPDNSGSRTLISYR